MKKFTNVLAVLVAFLVAHGCAQVVTAQTSGLIRHDHSSVSKGGNTISGATISGSTLVTPTVSGGTHSGGTFTSPTITGGTFTTPTISAPTITGTTSSTKSCASGYTRTAPNVCLRDGGSFTTTGLTRDVCTTVATPAADAKAVYLWVYTVASTANSVAARDAQVTSHTSSLCGNQTGWWHAIYAEFTAKTATDAAKMTGAQWVLADVANNAIYLKFTDDAGNTGSGGYRILGYSD